MNQRGIFDRVFGWCLGFFVACALIYLGVQLVKAVLAWLIVAAAIVTTIAVLGRVIMWQRQRW